LIGIGGMGRMHFNCYNNNPDAKIVAISDVDPAKLRGDWSKIDMNIGDEESGMVDLSGIATYSDYHDLIADPNVQLVDICLPTPQHAAATIAALQAGKDTLCEKPMAFTDDECATMEKAVAESGRQLLIGHCLRYWPQYVKAKEIMDSGEYGRVLAARFHRSSGTPWWSWENWLATGSRSGGAVLDMHIHDVDTALWWFGEPQSIIADGLVVAGLPLTVEAIWRYNDGPLVQLYGSWDNNGGPFQHGFKIVMEKASLVFDPATGVENLNLIQGGKDGDRSRTIEVSDDLAYQNEIDDYVACLNEGRKLERVTPQASRRSVAAVWQELRQIEEKNNFKLRP
jgi:predicted dehydrogenase